MAKRTNCYTAKHKRPSKTANSAREQFVATVKANGRGYAFLIPEGCAERERDFFVSANDLKGALNRDKVLAESIKAGGTAARVIKVLERGVKKLCGRFERHPRFGYVLPDDPAYASDVLVPLSLTMGASEGDKVLCELTSFPQNGLVRGKIIKIIGPDGELESEENAVIYSSDLRTEFPERVLAEADRVAKQPIDLTGRKDFRDLFTVTVDGADTRDIDDAISLKREGEKFILGVHIADVSHYVDMDGALEREAYSRGTSVYFPDRVLPMLPPALSNGACSLNEGEDRYALSCIMTFDGEGKRLGAKIYKSVIRSDRRLTYGEADEILAGGEGEIYETFESMKALTVLLENRKRQRGAVTLDVKEAHICLNERGEIEIPKFERTLSHRLIEQFMVAANEAVAERLAGVNFPCLYRIHEKPSPEKAASLYAFVRYLGVDAPATADGVAPRDFLKILSAVKDKPFAPVVNEVMLRSMQKARYDKKNAGHFGLASDCYCHFTSPIRRYPDLFVHRALKALIEGDNFKADALRDTAYEAAASSSAREREAELAERAVDDLYKLFYMQKRIGEQFDAIVSGVCESCIFAQLENGVEGAVRVELLPPDRYEYISEKFTMKGARHSFRLGDAVKVKAVGCDLGTRKVQFALV